MSTGVGALTGVPRRRLHCARWVWLLLLLALPTWAAGPKRSPRGERPVRPTRATMQKLRALSAHALVVVEGQEGRGPGILVGAGGEILTSVAHVGIMRARIHVGEASHQAKVLYANAETGLALVRAPPELQLHTAVPVWTQETFRPGYWVIAVTRDGEGAIHTHPLQWIEPPPAPGGTSGPRAALRKKLPLGTPLFDVRGRLVATVVQERRGISWALPIEVMQRVAASGAIE